MKKEGYFSGADALRSEAKSERERSEMIYANPARMTMVAPEGRLTLVFAEIEYESQRPAIVKITENNDARNIMLLSVRA